MLIGRKKELEQLGALAKTDRVVGLVGPSGVGKSELARAFALDRGSGVVVDCFGRGGGEISALLKHGELIGAASRPDDAEVLILDNWTPGIPIPTKAEFEGVVIVTAYEPPLEFTSLAIHPFATPIFSELHESDAYQAFKVAAERTRPGASATLSDKAVYAIIKSLGGHPLGLSIAGRHAAIFSAEEVLTLMREGVELEDLERDERQRSLAHAISFSWEQLPDEHRRCVYLLARFRRPVRVKAIARVCAMTVPQTMTMLVDLARRGVINTGPYPRPLEVWVEVALNNYRLSAPDDAQVIDDLIFEIAAESAPKEYLPDPSEISDSPSFWEAALMGGVANRDPEVAARILAALLTWSLSFAPSRFAETGYLEELADQLESTRAHILRAKFLGWGANRAHDAIERAWEFAKSPEERALVELERAVGASVVGDLAGALAHVEKARQEQDSPRACVLAAILLTFHGDHERAQKLVQEVTESGGLTSRMRVALGPSMAWSASSGTRVAVARKCLQEARDLGDGPGEIAMLRVLADTLDLEGLDERADAVRQEALERAQALEFHRMVNNINAERFFANFANLDAIKLDELSADVRIRLASARVVHACLDGDLIGAQHFSEMLSENVFSLPPMQDLVRTARFALWIDAGQPASKPEEPGPFDDLMQRVAEAHEKPEEEQFSCFEAFTELRQMHSHAARLAYHWAQNRLTPFMRRLARYEESEADVVILKDFRTFRADEGWQQIPETTGAILKAIATHEYSDFDSLAAAAWPDEQMTWDSLVNRVNVRVSALRKQGLKRLLLKTNEGFVLSGTVELEANSG